jgi:hypothetical protein
MLEMPLPDEAEEADALAIVEHVTRLAVAPNTVESYSRGSMRPVGRLKEWVLIPNG